MSTLAFEKNALGLPSQLVAFGLVPHLIYSKIPTTPVDGSKQFFLEVPGVARFLACPEENCILIDMAHADVRSHVLNTWLLGTVMAYMLQYHDCLVLHGSAVLIHSHAVIFSGASGAGKSTLASAFAQKGYPFITDDLVVIKKNSQNQYHILPGPTTLKLWKDAMTHFQYDWAHAMPVNFKTDKYAIAVDEPCAEPMIPISAFYELSATQSPEITIERLHSVEALMLLMNNAYRYFMLKPLGKIKIFFEDCSALSQRIAIHKLTRTADFHDLPQLIHRIELNQGVTS
ncbi:MAG: hypothetical protein NTW94_05855 [Legionellales bacterium]|nr:hypothetical protein [Legionellales bacterium]